MDPSWAPDGSILLSDKTVRPNLDIMVDRLGDGNQVIQGWFEDTDVWYFRQAEMNRQGTALVAVTTRPKSVDEPLYEDDQVTIYRLNGAPPVLPEPCYFYTGPDGALLQPDLVAGRHAHRVQQQRRLAQRRDILVGEVPSQAGGRALPAAGASVVIEGAEFPTGARPTSRAGPAPAPGAARAGPGDADRARGAAPGARPAATARSARRSACGGAPARRAGRGPHRAGHRVRGRRVRLVARRGRTIVARGAARADARGRATIRLRFTAAARRSLRGSAGSRSWSPAPGRPGRSSWSAERSLPPVTPAARRRGGAARAFTPRG